MTELCSISISPREACMLMFDRFKHARASVTDKSKLVQVTKKTFDSLDIWACEFYNTSPDDADGVIVDMTNNSIAVFGSDNLRKEIKQQLRAVVRHVIE